MKCDFDVDTLPAALLEQPVRVLVREAPVPEHLTAQVQAELGFDYLQARGHVRQRLWLQRHPLPDRRFEQM